MAKITLWAARDLCWYDDSVTFYSEKPVCHHKINNNGKVIERIFAGAIFSGGFWPKGFPEITWENSPIKITLECEDKEWLKFYKNHI